MAFCIRTLSPFKGMVEVCIQVGWNIGVQPRKRFKRMMELIRIIAWVSSTFTFPQTDWADQLLHALMHIFFAPYMCLFWMLASSI